MEDESEDEGWLWRQEESPEPCRWGLAGKASKAKPSRWNKDFIQELLHLLSATQFTDK